MTYNNYLKRMMVYVRMKDNDYLSLEDRTACLAAAVSDHTKYKPLVRFHDIDGDGSYDYDVPSDWWPAFSELLSIEYPAGNRDRTFIDGDDYGVVWNGAEWKIRFLAVTPDSGYTIRIEYTTGHKLDSDTDTILGQDFAALCMLAGSHCCASLAAKYTGSTDSTLSSDVVELVTRRSEYSALEKSLRKKYFHAIGADEEQKGPAPAMEIGDIDPKFANREDYLTHLRKYR